jgi:hypothetical protein
LEQKNLRKLRLKKKTLKRYMIQEGVEVIALCDLSDENINMDARTYADGAGKLHVVLPIGSIAGADSYEQVLALDGVGE